MNNQGVTRAADARADIYTSVTDQIVATIEAGAATYTFPPLD
jgi:antirestriction protein ArdC